MNQVKIKPERKLACCPKCGKPLAAVRGSEVEVEKYNRGDSLNTVIKVEHNAGGRFTVKCKSCGAAAFSTVQKSLPITYIITGDKKSKAKRKTVDKSL